MAGSTPEAATTKPIAAAAAIARRRTAPPDSPESIIRLPVIAFRSIGTSFAPSVRSSLHPDIVNEQIEGLALRVIPDLDIAYRLDLERDGLLEDEPAVDPHPQHGATRGRAQLHLHA